MYNNQSVFPVSVNQSSSSELVLELKCYWIYYKYPLYGWQKYIHMIFPVVYALIWLLSVALNAAALLVYSRKSMRKLVSNLLILNTIFADLCTGMLCMPLATAYYIVVVYFHRISCVFYAYFSFFGFVSTVVSFLMASFAVVDRYLAVFTPYFYSTQLAHWTSLYYKIMISTWIFSVFIVGVSYLTLGFTPAMYFIIAQPLVLLVHIVMNIRLWNAIRKIRKKLRREIRVLAPVQLQAYVITNKNQVDDSPTLTNDISPDKSNQSIQRKKPILQNNSALKEFIHDLPFDHKNFRIVKRKEPIVHCNSRFSNESSITLYRTNQIERENVKSTCIMSFMLISLCFCYLPFFVIAAIWKTAEEDLDIHNTLGTVASTMVVLKSVLNPIIYWYSMPSVKKKMRNVLIFWKKH